MTPHPTTIGFYPKYAKNCLESCFRGLFCTKKTFWAEIWKHGHMQVWKDGHSRLCIDFRRMNKPIMDMRLLFLVKMELGAVYGLK